MIPSNNKLESLISKSEYLQTLQTTWIIPSSKIRKSLQHYFLRHWTASEICDKLDGEILSLYDTSFQAVMTSRCRAYLARKLLNPNGRKYWLSFRAGYYDGQYHAYVIIEIGKKPKETEESNHDA